MVTDNYAFDVWRTMPQFRAAFEQALDSVRVDAKGVTAWRTESFRRYSYSRIFSAVIYKNMPPQYDGMYLFVRAREQRSYWTACRIFSGRQVFERVIIHLLPEAREWDSEWCSEAYILRRIKKVHGLDVTRHYDDFDLLVSLVTNLLAGQPYTAQILQFKRFSMNLAKAIWPENTEDEIQECFLKIWRKYDKQKGKKRILGANYKYEVVTKHWIYTQIREWYETKSVPLRPAVRSKLLSISMNI